MVNIGGLEMIPVDKPPAWSKEELDKGYKYCSQTHDIECLCGWKTTDNISKYYAFSSYKSHRWNFHLDFNFAPSGAYKEV